VSATPVRQQSNEEPPGAKQSIFRWLDLFLSEELRRAGPTLVFRCRMLAGVACILSLANLFFLIQVLVTPLPPRFLVAAVLTLASSLGALVLLRRSASPWPALALMVASLLAPPIFVSLFQANPYVSTSAMVMLAPAVAVYLLGPRRGLFVSLFMSLLVGVAAPLYRTWTGTGSPPYYAQHGVLHLVAGLSIMVSWWLNSLYSAARDRAQVALELALRTIRTSESRLLSLIESTEEIVCSIDTQGRLLTANSALRAWCLRRFGEEPRLGQELLGLMPREPRERWRAHFARAFAGERVRFEDVSVWQDTTPTLDVSLNPIFEEGVQVVGLTLFAQDITSRRQAELRLQEVHRTLMDVSRQAGMAEIATGVLHNVGNALNSVNISAGLLADRLRNLRLEGLEQALALLHANSADLGAFFATDPRGQKLLNYLAAVVKRTNDERTALLAETQALTEGLEHIKSIVSVQQEHARFIRLVERLAVPHLMDDALRLHLAAFEREGIQVQREYGETSEVDADRHHLLQILLNLLSNARHALLASDRPDKRVTLRVRPGDPGRVCIEVSDNGVGISPENLPRMFSQGFTTKKSGHGFGLHLSALAASEMKGRLTCTSAGVGQGATFVLELPLAYPSTVSTPGSG